MILGAQIVTPLLVHKSNGEKSIVFADFYGDSFYDSSGVVIKDHELKQELTDWLQKQFISSMSVLDDLPVAEFNKVVGMKEDILQKAHDVRSTENFVEPQRTDTKVDVEGDAEATNNGNES